jgi:hypothetical protein
MSPHFYERFLTLVDEVCRKAAGLRVITTTTPPPDHLNNPPACILKLSRASDEDLLLKRRIENRLALATPSSSDASDEAE